MQEYAKQRFLDVGPEQRSELCAKLAESLSAAVASSPDFRGAVRRSVDALRQAGHDLWSIDEADEFEVWGPNYQDPTGPGLILTFPIADSVAVEWTE
jgi:hypothetical protein